MVRMVNTGIMSALVRDLATYAAYPEFAGERDSVYKAVHSKTAALKKLLAAMPVDIYGSSGGGGGGGGVAAVAALGAGRWGHPFTAADWPPVVVR